MSQGYRNQKRQVPLKVGRASAHNEGVHVEVGLAEGRKSSFE